MIHALFVKSLDYKSMVKTTFIVKSLLVPFYLFYFIIGVIAVLTGFLIIFALPVILFVVFLISVFIFIIVLTTSIYNIRVIYSNKNKLPKLYYIYFCLYFIYVIDYIVSILMFIDLNKFNINSDEDIKVIY